MSLIPVGTLPPVGVDLYASVQVAVTSAALYDHALALGREVELIWMKPLTLVTLLYVIERYLGDIVLVAGLCCKFRFIIGAISIIDLWNSVFFSINIRKSIRLFEFRAWGALVYSWATQATMQLRLYAMYRRSRRILILLLTAFFCEIAAIAFIIWRAIGPHSALKAINDDVVPGDKCSFSGINGSFVYIFIPFLCFESLLFFLAARVFIENVQRKKDKVVDEEDLGFRVNPFVSILMRDSICYFFVNLVGCAVVMGLWQGVTELYANVCVPVVMFIEVLVGTRLILGFRERYARSNREPAFSGGYSSLQFRRDDVRTDSTPLSIRCQIETIVVTDADV